MAEPWRCPDCHTWIRGDVAEHRCPPDGGVAAEVSSPQPGQPPARVATHPWHLWCEAGGGGGSGAGTGGGVTYIYTHPHALSGGAEIVSRIAEGLHSVDETQCMMGKHPWGGGDPAA